jgi:putative membrane protein
MHQARMGALLVGTALSLAACTPGGDKGDTNQPGENGAAAATSTDSGTVAGAAMGTGDSAGGAMAGGAMAGAMGDPAIMGTINTSNAAEITTSELALEKATNAEVKSYARDMIAEHRTMQKQADQLAQKAQTPAQPAAKADQMQGMVTASVDSMKALSGAQFDQKYMAFQVQSHQMTLDNLRRFENQAQNAELKAMITKAIPAVQGHLERAQKIQTSLGGAAGATKS